MTIRTATETPWWAWAWPLLALVMLGLQLLLHSNVLITAFEAFALIVTVFAARMKITQYMEPILPCTALYLLIRVTFSTPTPPLH